jgi:hypothetical protein
MRDPWSKSCYKRSKKGCATQGWINGKNLAIEHRFAEGRVERLSALAVELEKL